MKVCLLSGEFPPMQGGVGDFTREVGLALNRLGATVSVVSSTKACTGPEPGLQPAGKKVIERNGCSLDLFPIVGNWGFSSWPQLVTLLRHLKPDILNIQYQTAAYQMHPAINLLPWRLRWSGERPGVVTTFHDLKLPYLFPKAGIVRRWVTKALVTRSEANIVTNVEDHAKAQEYGARKSRLIPIGSNINPEAPVGYDRAKWRRRWGVQPHDVLLSYFGFLHESKGGEALVRALAQLTGSGRNVKLLMIGGRVGSSDPTNVAYLQTIETLIEKLGLTDRVLWTGYVDGQEVSANFWATDICVLPYRDGASFRRGTLMAALAHGVPVVSTYPQVEVAEIRENVNMALVPPDDAQALADKIGELAASPALRRRLASGAAALSGRFAWGSIASETLEVYEEVLRVLRPVAGTGCVC
jgi:glycosyltransferase involved in cell wall biosynthesis